MILALLRIHESDIKAWVEFPRWQYATQSSKSICMGEWIDLDRGTCNDVCLNGWGSEGGVGKWQYASVEAASDGRLAAQFKPPPRYWTALLLPLSFKQDQFCLHTIYSQSGTIYDFFQWTQLFWLRIWRWPLPLLVDNMGAVGGGRRGEGGCRLLTPTHPQWLKATGTDNRHGKNPPPPIFFETNLILSKFQFGNI